jgi:hypothetical protein
MNTLLDRLKRLFASGSDNVNSEKLITDVEAPAVETKATLDDSSLARLMELIEQTQEGEYSCQETLDLLDEYAELVAQHQDAETIMPFVKGHLEHCVDCSERYEALLIILEEPEG